MRIKKIILCLLLAFCLLSFLNAQSEGWYYGKQIKFITFKGLSAINATDLLDYTNPYIGKEFTDETYIEILNTIYSLNYFADISAEVKPSDSEGTGLNLEFTVTEYPAIKAIVIMGNTKVRNYEITEILSMKQNEVFVEEKLSVNERKIRDMYLEKGYTEVRVTSKVEELEDGISVIFTVSEGNPSVVSEIRFEGNEVFSSKTLKNQCAMKETSFFQKGAFKESTLERDTESLLSYYKNRGYIDAEITEVRRDITHNESKEQDEVVLTFVIHEGDQFRYSGITFSGNTVFDDDRLLLLMKLAPGDIFNVEKFDESLGNVIDLYLQNGYISNGFDYSLNRNDDTHEISCSMIIQERSRGHIEKLVIQGNSKTKDYVILRELGIETGDIYSKTAIQNGLRNLYNTQYFSAIEPEFEQGSEMNLIDMTLTVEEGQTASVMFGVTFSGIADTKELPMSAYVELTDTNVGGLGKTVSTNFTVSSSEQSLSLSYSDSWFLNMPLSVQTSVYASNANKTCLQDIFMPSGLNSSTYMDYQELTLGAAGAIGKRWNRNLSTITLTGGVSSDFSRNNYDAMLYTPADASIRANHNSWGIKNGIWSSLSLDTRDIYYDPSSGIFLNEKLSWYGLIPSLEQEFYLLSETKAEYYTTLCDVPATDVWNFKLVFCALTNLSILQPLKEDSIGYQNKLYIDGMFNGRGWKTLYNQRGNAMWSNSIEFRVPLAEGILAMDVFADAVVVKKSAQDLFTNTKLDDFYFSFGPGLRFSIPQFPIRLLLANTVKFNNGKAEWDNRWAFTLSFNLPNR